LMTGNHIEPMSARQVGDSPKGAGKTRHSDPKQLAPSS
jgi:hypothetical protein